MSISNIIQNIEKLDPEVYNRLDSRRSVFKHLGVFGKTLTAAALPLALGTLFNKAYGQTASDVTDALKFALTLEYLEEEFYVKGLQATGLIPASDRAIFEQIKKHESAHVAFLKSALGTAAQAKPTFDFSAGNGSNTGPFATVFTNYDVFLALSQAFEDTGVRAYKGQAPRLVGNSAVLTNALQIHSVEARHAAEVRLLRSQQPWVTTNDNGAPNIAAAQTAYMAIYAGENSTTQEGITRANYTTVAESEVAEAFDEFLTKEQVMTIVDPFIV